MDIYVVNIHAYVVDIWVGVHFQLFTNEDPSVHQVVEPIRGKTRRVGL